MALTEDDFAALDEMENEANTRLRESEVVRHLLPHLIPDPNNPQKRRVDIYVAAAGSPTRMIDVVSDTDRNKVLYTIPPLISPTPMIIRDREANPATDIGELTAQFEAEITNGHPQMVINGFVGRLMQLNYTPAEAIETIYAKMWAMIYKRYNIPLERLFGDQAEEVERAISGVKTPEGNPSGKQGSFIDETDEDDFDPI